MLHRIASLVLLFTPVTAQMSGTYTLDPAGTGTRNFTDFRSMSFSVSTRGVSGPVIINVAAGTYADQNLLLYPVPGSSSSSTITIRGPQQRTAVLRYQSGPSGGGVRADSSKTLRARHFVIENLHFTRPLGYRNEILNGDDLVFRNCRFERLRLNVLGKRQEFDSCEFWGPRSFLADGDDDLLVHHCHMHQVETAGPALELRCTSFGFGRTRIYNNVITFAVAGYLSLTNGADFHHNTVVALPSAGNQSMLLQLRGTFLGYIHVSNNVVAHLGGGSLLSIRGDTSAFAAVCHNNLFYNSASNPRSFRYDPSTSLAVDYRTLAAYRAASGLEKGSIQADPMFLDSKSLPLGLKPHPNSPTVGNANGTPAYITDDYEGNTRSTPSFLGALGPGQPSTFTPFGRGCAGTQSKIPTIGYGGDLKLGSSNFEVKVGNALGSITGQAFLVLGLQKTKFNFGGACDLLVRPLILLRTSIQGSGAGNGTATFKLPIPNKPSLKGKLLHFQWGVTDAAAAGIQLAMTPGATLAF